MQLQIPPPLTITGSYSVVLHLALRRSNHCLLLWRFGIQLIDSVTHFGPDFGRVGQCAALWSTVCRPSPSRRTRRSESTPTSGFLRFLPRHEPS